MFRTQEKIPEVYINTSRDFQLLCRINDAIQGATKYTIDSLRHLSNTLEMNSTLLPLLKSKVGFFKTENLSEDQLRYLLTGFPYLIKYKGSKKAIYSAIYLWFRVNRIGAALISVNINNSDHTIEININTIPQDTALLDTLLSYLIPTGYIINYNFATAVNETSKFNLVNCYAGAVITKSSNSQIRTNDVDDVIIRHSTNLSSSEFTDFKESNFGTIGGAQVYNPLDQEGV